MIKYNCIFCWCSAPKHLLSCPVSKNTVPTLKKQCSHKKLVLSVVIWSNFPFIIYFAESKKSFSCSNKVLKYLFTLNYFHPLHETSRCKIFPFIIFGLKWHKSYRGFPEKGSLSCSELPRKKQVSLCNKSRHYAFIIHRVKTCFFLKRNVTWALRDR